MKVRPLSSLPCPVPRGLGDRKNQICGKTGTPSNISRRPFVDGRRNIPVNRLRIRRAPLSHPSPFPGPRSGSRREQGFLGEPSLQSLEPLLNRLQIILPLNRLHPGRGDRKVKLAQFNDDDDLAIGHELR